MNSNSITEAKTPKNTKKQKLSVQLLLFSVRPILQQATAILFSPIADPFSESPIPTTNHLHSK